MVKFIFCLPPETSRDIAPINPKAGVANLLRSIINAVEKTERALAIDVLNREIVNMMLVYSELEAKVEHGEFENL